MAIIGSSDNRTLKKLKTVDITMPFLPVSFWPFFVTQMFWGHLYPYATFIPYLTPCVADIFNSLPIDRLTSRHPVGGHSLGPCSSPVSVPAGHARAAACTEHRQPAARAPSWGELAAQHRAGG